MGMSGKQYNLTEIAYSEDIDLTELKKINDDLSSKNHKLEYQNSALLHELSSTKPPLSIKNESRLNPSLSRDSYLLRTSETAS
jgi:hypothetical protein